MPTLMFVAAVIIWSFWVYLWRYHFNNSTVSCCCWKLGLIPCCLGMHQGCVGREPVYIERVCCRNRKIVKWGLWGRSHESHECCSENWVVSLLASGFINWFWARELHKLSLGGHWWCNLRFWLTQLRRSEVLRTHSCSKSQQGCALNTLCCAALIAQKSQVSIICRLVNQTPECELYP